MNIKFFKYLSKFITKCYNFYKFSKDVKKYFTPTILN